MAIVAGKPGVLVTGWSHLTAVTVTENSDQRKEQCGLLYDGGAVGFREPKKPWMIAVVYQGSEKPLRTILPRSSDHTR